MVKITVLLPVFNGQNFLEESVRSVLSQSFKNFALHILDDCSSDSSADIAKSFVACDDRVYYSRNKSKLGLYGTLNRGFLESESDWVRLWAHDDRMKPHCLEMFSAFVENHPEVGMVYSNFEEIDDRGSFTGGEIRYMDQRNRTPLVADPKVSALLLLCFGCLPGNISTCMLSRGAWKEMGGFQEGLQQTPDYQMWTRLSARYHVGYINEKTIDLRAHPLQLGRHGHKQLTTLEEMKFVFDLLLERLVPSLMTEREFRAYWRRCQGCGHTQSIMRAFLRGDIKLFIRGVRSVVGYGMPISQGLTWLVSGNGRMIRNNSGKFFDSMFQRV